jgi:HprK-related kinase A
LTVGQLTRRDLAARLKSGALRIRTGPFVTCVQTVIPAIVDSMALLYADFPLESSPGFADFHVRLAPASGPRRWWRRQAIFFLDGEVPFEPLPLRVAVPFLEWSLNWCVSHHAHQYLVIHAGALERNGRAMILPAPSGHGKSTLCAALVHRGWRLLSDELALVHPSGGRLAPLPRPISLKNQSIQVIQASVPDAIMSRPTRDTRKGTVALVRPPRDAVLRAGEHAHPAWVVFPAYQAGAQAELVTLSKARTLLRIAESCFNYTVHGAEGFQTLAELVDRCQCYEFRYSDLDQATALFDSLAR